MILTGTLTFSDFNFSFVFDEKLLRIIPITEENRVILFGVKDEKISDGVTQFIPQPLQVIEDKYIIGFCNETSSKIVFFPVSGTHINSINNLFNPKAPVSIPLSAYILFDSEKETIDRMAICCPELNYIHPITQALEHQFSMEGLSTGEVSVNTIPFDQTTTEKQTFAFKDKTVGIYFGISIKLSNKIHEAPLTLTSTMYFEFEPTEDYSFILDLWRIARQFVRFLCYRRNICIPQIELSAPAEEGKHEKNAILHLLEEKCETELKPLEKGRYIKQQYIAGHEGEILTDIIEKTICTRHLPDTSSSGRSITAARFVMITAAFEWEFKRAYPSGINHSKASMRASAEVEKQLQELYEESKGKKKKIYKRLLGNVYFDSLASEICQAAKDYSHIVGVFGEQLFALNDEKLDYSQMGTRLADQRNAFAHGKLDIELNGLSLLDLAYIEFLIYAMQLKKYNIDEEKIQKAINELFGRNVALK